MLTRGLIALTAAVLATASAGVALPAAAATSLPMLTHHGRWLIDPQGRVVILHGVQVDKFQPTVPIEFIDLAPANVRFMADQGFNLARVSLAYEGAEPALGQFDDTYIDSYRAFDQELSDAGIYDLVDMMQGEYSRPVGGWGFPPWMTRTDGLPNTITTFPLGYLDNPAENRAWDNFYANAPAADNVGLEDHYATGLGHIAARFGNAPALLGFEVLNEPWSGSQWPSCASTTGCPPVVGFDQTVLTAFYHRVVPALRAADPGHLIVYEPNLFFDYGAATGVGSSGDPNAVFAFHNYCLGNSPGFPPFDPGHDCGVEEQMVIANAQAQTQRTGDALLMDEWGNNPDPTLIQRMAQEADQAMVGWSYWALEDCCGSAGAIIKDGTKAATAPGNLNTVALDALVRAYPQAIAGTPTRWNYDPSGRMFQLGYGTQLVDGTSGAGMLTDVFVPSLQYPGGYSVAVSGAEVAAGNGTQHLVLRNCPGATAVTLTISPGAAAAPPSCSAVAVVPEVPLAAGLVPAGIVVVLVFLVRRRRTTEPGTFEA